MKYSEILQECLAWHEELQKIKVKPHKNYKTYRKKMKEFTKESVEKIMPPKHKVHDITSQFIHDPEDYPIFFIREREIFAKEYGLTWVYFGSLFDIKDEKVRYRTTTSYIPEKFLLPFQLENRKAIGMHRKLRYIFSLSQNL